jgi:hypothetical protein
LIGYEYKGKSRIIIRGAEVSPFDLLSLHDETIKNALKWGVIREIKIKEDGANKEAKKARRTNVRTSTKKGGKTDREGDEVSNES